MSEERVILVDENGDENEFEVVVSFEVNDQDYAVLQPVKGDEEVGIIFKVFDEEGEQTFEYLSDEDEFEFVANAYQELMDESEEE